MEFKVLKPGQKIKLNNGLEVLITEVCVKSEFDIQYRFVWWDGKTRKNEWLDSHELADTAEPTAKIGFYYEV